MTDDTNVLVVTVDDEGDPYREGLDAIRQLTGGESVDQPAIVRFPNESQLTDVFNERTYTLLGVIRDEQPDSIRETARLVGRDKKNVHEELTTLEALGVIRFEEEGRAKRPVFPYDDLVVTPLTDRSGDSSRALP
jgi:predicted transcriptional regulator